MPFTDASNNSMCFVIPGCADASQYDSSWVKKSIGELQKQFLQGVEFIVITPAFQTLRQQTLQRIVDAGLADGHSENVVNPYIWASKVTWNCESHMHLLKVTNAQLDVATCTSHSSLYVALLTVNMRSLIISKCRTRRQM